MLLIKVNWDKELEEEAEKLRKKKRESIRSSISSIRPLSTPPVIPQPLPKPQSSSPKPSRTNMQTIDLLGLGKSENFIQICFIFFKFNLI